MENFNEQFNFIGNVELLNLQNTVFFCPFEVTNDVFKYIRQWVDSLRNDEDVVVCGNSTGVERFTLRLLLNKGFAVILPLATTIPGALEELNLGWKLSNEESTKMLNDAFDARRLLIVSSKENVSVSVPTRKTVQIRDEWMREIGDSFVIAAGREFDYYDRFLLGRPVIALSAALPEEDEEDLAEMRRQESVRMGWSIYRRLKAGIESSEVLNQLVARYLQLDIERPSLLHSLVLMAVAVNYSDRESFDFQSFLRTWSIQNLRPEDKLGYRSKEGKFLPSLADRCVSRLFRQMPSREMMSLGYNRPFDTTLVHQWLDVVLQQSPNNQRNVRKALRLAYYEHDGAKIDYYKQRLAM